MLLLLCCCSLQCVKCRGVVPNLFAKTLLLLGWWQVKSREVCFLQFVRTVSSLRNLKNYLKKKKTFSKYSTPLPCLQSFLVVFTKPDSATINRTPNTTTEVTK